MSVKIRHYLPQDFQAIADIYNESIMLGGITMDCDLYSANQIEALVKKFGQRETLLVAEGENEVIGWGIIKKYSDRFGYRFCCETSIYLKLSQTKKGYGYLLQSTLLERVKAFGYHHVVAKITAANQTSIKFHQKFGFEFVGIQKEIGFYGEKWHDIAIMQLILST